MARSGAKSSYRVRKTRPALERYNRLNSFDQLICYYYWRYIITKGLEGWDTKKAGWKEHWTHYSAIKEKYSPSAFYSLGKTLVELAKEISSQGQHLNEPDISGAKFEPEAEVEDEDEDEEEKYDDDKEFEDKDSPNIDATMPTKNSTASARMKVPEPLKDSVSNNKEPTLPYPMVWGSFKTFNLTTRKRHTNIVFRVLVHSFMRLPDIDFTWINPRKLRIKVAWPDWWVNPEQQAEFDIDEMTGMPIYDIAHELIGDMMEINESKKEEDGRVWDVGYFTFDQNMSTDPIDTVIDLKPLVVASAGQQGQFISVKTVVDQQDASKKQSPLKVNVSSRMAKPGTGGGGKTSSRTRKQGVHNNDMDIDDGDSGASRTGKKTRTVGGARSLSLSQRRGRSTTRSSIVE